MAVPSRLPGYGYNPTVQEIFSLLEKMKVDKKPTDEYRGLIHECNLFGQKIEPSQIWENHGGDQAHGQQLFFAFELKRTGKNISRKIGRDGTWSESGSKVIEHNPIGRIRNFRFETKRESDDYAKWRLEEFSLCNPAAAHDNTKASKNHYDSDFVICKMRRNPGENKRKRSNDQNTNNVEEPQMAETLEDVPSRSVGPAWVGADEEGPLHPHYTLEDHQPKDHHYQMDVEHEGAIEANYQSNDLEEVFYRPFAYGTSNDHFESFSDIEL